MTPFFIHIYMSKLETAFIVNKNIKHKNVNKLLWRPTHSRQDIDKNDKYSIKEINKNNLDLEIPMHKNDLYNNFSNYTDKPIINEEPKETVINDEQDTIVEEELEPEQVEEEYIVYEEIEPYEQEEEIIYEEEVVKKNVKMNYKLFSVYFIIAIIVIFLLKWIKSLF